jgi:hypothetical protein
VSYPLVLLNQRALIQDLKKQSQEKNFALWNRWPLSRLVKPR